MMYRHHPHDDGVSVIELIIAMFILAIVMVGGLLAFTGSTHSHFATKVRAAQTSTGEKIYESLKANRDWTRTCPNADNTPPYVECDDLSSLFATDLYAHNSELKTTFDVSVKVTPIDSSADGLKSADTDGVTVDFYDVAVQIAAKKTDAGRLRHPKPMRFQSTIDPSRTRGGTGSVLVQVCRTTNQVDERMSIAGCDSHPRKSRMDRCAPGSYPASAASPFAACTTFANPDVPNEYKRLDIKSTSHNTVTFTLRGPITPSSPGSNHLSTAATWKGDGAYLFEGLAPGQYEVTHVTLPPNWEEWASHIIPAKGFVTVENQQQDRALIMLNPRASGTFSINFNHDTREMVFGSLETLKDLWTSWPNIGVYTNCWLQYKIYAEWKGYKITSNELYSNRPGASSAATVSTTPSPWGRVTEGTSIPVESDSVGACHERTGCADPLSITLPKPGLWSTPYPQPSGTITSGDHEWPKYLWVPNPGALTMHQDTQCWQFLMGTWKQQATCGHIIYPGYVVPPVDPASTSATLVTSKCYLIQSRFKIRNIVDPLHPFFEYTDWKTTGGCDNGGPWICTNGLAGCTAAAIYVPPTGVSGTTSGHTYSGTVPTHTVTA